MTNILLRSAVFSISRGSFWTPGRVVSTYVVAPNTTRTLKQRQPLNAKVTSWNVVIAPQNPNDRPENNPYGLINIPIKVHSLYCYPYGTFELDKILVKYNVNQMKDDLTAELALYLSNNEGYFDTSLLQKLAYEILVHSPLGLQDK